MAVLVGVGVGESDVHSNVVYFKDPRPGAGTLEVQGVLCERVGRFATLPCFHMWHLVV